MNRTYDIAVVGAGPAGIFAVREILAQGSTASVVLMERRSQDQCHATCAEGVFEHSFASLLEPRKEWIRCTVTNALYYAPDGTSVAYPGRDRGYIIDRARLQCDLTEECRENGADVRHDCRVIDVSEPDRNGLRTILAGRDKVCARVVIDASGPLSGLGKREEIDWKPCDLEVGYFAHVQGTDTDPATVHLYVGRQIAPGGYAWVFPHGGDTANVGVIVGSGTKGSVNVRSLLNRFIAERFPQARVTRHFAGTIPCTARKAVLAIPGLIKAGDAASMVNPISRAGIMEAMTSGGLAGAHALAMLGVTSSRKSRGVCRHYEKALHRQLGSKHLRLAKVKRFLPCVPDEDYNRGAHILAGIPRGELSMSRIFSLSLGRFPRLVWALRHII